MEFYVHCHLRFLVIGGVKNYLVIDTIFIFTCYNILLNVTLGYNLFFRCEYKIIFFIFISPSQTFCGLSFISIYPLVLKNYHYACRLNQIQSLKIIYI